jgi:MinD-like ATPase involved in chromosome partitioning or flagellar assembly
LAELVSIVFLGRYALELYSHKNPPRIIPALEKDNYQKGVDAVFIDTGTETQERVIVGAIDFTSSIRKFL